MHNVNIDIYLPTPMDEISSSLPEKLCMLTQLRLLGPPLLLFSLNFPFCPRPLKPSKIQQQLINTIMTVLCRDYIATWKVNWLQDSWMLGVVMRTLPHFLTLWNRNSQMLLDMYKTKVCNHYEVFSLAKRILGVIMVNRYVILYFGIIAGLSEGGRPGYISPPKVHVSLPDKF